MFKVCCLLFVFPTKTLTHVHLIIRSFFEWTLVITRYCGCPEKIQANVYVFFEVFWHVLKNTHCCFSSTTYSMNPAVV